MHGHILNILIDHMQVSFMKHKNRQGRIDLDYGKMQIQFRHGNTEKETDN